MAEADTCLGDTDSSGSHSNIYAACYSEAWRILCRLREIAKHSSSRGGNEYKAYGEAIESLKRRAEEAPMITASAGAAASLAFLISHAAALLDTRKRGDQGGRRIIKYLWKKAVDEEELRTIPPLSSFSKDKLGYAAYTVYLARVFEKLGLLQAKKNGMVEETVFKPLLEASIHGTIPYRLLLRVEEFSKQVFIILVNMELARIEAGMGAGS